MSATMRIKKGDMVQIIAGKDKASPVKLLLSTIKKGVVYVEGLNMITKHTKPSMANQQGGIIHTEVLSMLQTLCTFTMVSRQEFSIRSLTVKKFVQQRLKIRLQ